MSEAATPRVQFNPESPAPMWEEAYRIRWEALAAVAEDIRAMLEPQSTSK